MGNTGPIEASQKKWVNKIFPLQNFFQVFRLNGGKNKKKCYHVIFLVFNDLTNRSEEKVLFPISHKTLLIKLNL